MIIMLAGSAGAFVLSPKGFRLKIPSLQRKFKDGQFVTNYTFSTTAMDQSQEHNDKKIKSNSGYTDQVNSEEKQSLQKL